MTSSGQSHQLRTGTVKKPDLTSRVFLRLSLTALPFFLPHLKGFLFQFFCCGRCCRLRWPAARCRRRHFCDFNIFSKLQHARCCKKQSVFLMDAVAAVRYVKSEVLSEELHTRFCREEGKPSHERRATESFLDEKLIKGATASQCFSNRFWRTSTTRPVFRFTIFFKLILGRRFRQRLFACFWRIFGQAKQFFR